MKTVGFRPMVIWAITCIAFLGFSSGALATDLTPFTTSSGEGLTVVQEGVGLGGLTSATTGGGSIPLTITINGTVDEAFLYWAGRDSKPCTDLDADCIVVPLDQPFRDQEIVFDGNAITGMLIGQENQLPSRSINNIGYREDVTSIVLAKGEGTHTFLIEDGDTSNNLDSLNGATLLVVYTDSTDPTSYEVQVFDGLDFAYIGDSALHAQVTVPIVFGYLAESSSRTADLLLSVGDAKDSRPDRIDVSDTTGTTSFTDELNSMNGRMWDAWTKPITIPADVSSTTVQLFSEGNPNNTKTPDSLLWEMAALRIPIEADVVDIDIRKQEEGADSRTFPSGSDVPFEIVVTNTGTVDLINVVVTDLLVADCDNMIGNLAVGASVTYTCTDLDVQAGYTNVAEVTGEANGETVMDEDPSTVVIAGIDIRKQAEGDDSRTFPSGANVDFEIVVTNTGAVDLTNVVVTDALLPACDNVIGNLAVGVSVTYTCTATNVTVGFENIACVEGEDVPNGTVDDCDPSEVEIPGIDIRKQAEGPDSRSFPSGSDVDFLIVVTNTGTADLTNVVVTDAEVSGCDLVIGNLAVGASVSYTCTALDVTVGFTNVAGVTGVSDGVIVEDDDPSTVVIEPVSGTCLDGKPKELMFDYTPSDCTTTNPQEGKFTCSGVLDSAIASVSSSDGVITFAGSTVTITASGDKFGAQTDMTITDVNGNVQDLGIHTSCSKELNVGDIFGSLELTVFTPGTSGGGMGGMGGMGSKVKKVKGGMN